MKLQRLTADDYYRLDFDSIKNYNDAGIKTNTE